MFLRILRGDGRYERVTIKENLVRVQVENDYFYEINGKLENQKDVYIFLDFLLLVGDDGEYSSNDVSFAYEVDMGSGIKHQEWPLVGRNLTPLQILEKIELDIKRESDASSLSIFPAFIKRQLREGRRLEWNTPDPRNNFDETIVRLEAVSRPEQSVLRPEHLSSPKRKSSVASSLLLKLRGKTASGPTQQQGEEDLDEEGPVPDATRRRNDEYSSRNYFEKQEYGEYGNKCGIHALNNILRHPTFCFSFVSPRDAHRCKEGQVNVFLEYGRVLEKLMREKTMEEVKEFDEFLAPSEDQPYVSFSLEFLIQILILYGLQVDTSRDFERLPPTDRTLGYLVRPLNYHYYAVVPRRELGTNSQGQYDWQALDSVLRRGASPIYPLNQLQNWLSTNEEEGWKFIQVARINMPASLSSSEQIINILKPSKNALLNTGLEEILLNNEYLAEMRRGGGSREGGAQMRQGGGGRERLREGGSAREQLRQGGGGEGFKEREREVEEEGVFLFATGLYKNLLKSRVTGNPLTRGRLYEIGVHNSSSAEWPEDVRLMLYTGEENGGPKEGVKVNYLGRGLKPGENVIVDLALENVIGDAEWKLFYPLKSGGGVFFGQSFFIALSEELYKPLIEAADFDW